MADDAPVVLTAPMIIEYPFSRTTGPVIGAFLTGLREQVLIGIKGRDAGRNLPDKTAYYLSIAGLWISGFAIAVLILVLAACVGLLGVAGLSGGLIRW